MFHFLNIYLPATILVVAGAVFPLFYRRTKKTGYIVVSTGLIFGGGGFGGFSDCVRRSYENVPIDPCCPMGLDLLPFFRLYHTSSDAYLGWGSSPLL